MQILGSVLNNEIVQSTNEQQPSIKKDQAYDNAPYEKHLEQPQKLNSLIDKNYTNFMLWREICKKRDALYQLMLNELTVDN
jgi:hypothetical protein